MNHDGKEVDEQTRKFLVATTTLYFEHGFIKVYLNTNYYYIFKFWSLTEKIFAVVLRYIHLTTVLLINLPV